MIFPIYLSVIQSLKPVEELFLFPPRLYVQNITDQNFADLLATASNMWVPFSRYVFNSVFVAVVVTVAQLLFSSSAAYALSKVAFPGAKALNKIIEVALLFTSTVLYIMQYMVMATLGMIDTYFAIILPYIAKLPDSMIEAAKLDGASHIRICWQIVMPNVKPAWLTLLIFAFQGAWQITGYSFIYNEALKPIPTVMQQISAAGIFAVIAFGKEARAGKGKVKAFVQQWPVANHVAHVETVTQTHSHILKIEAEVAIRLRDHPYRHIAFKVHGVRIEPVVVHQTRLPAFAGTLHIFAVVIVESLVGPVVDVDAEPHEAWIYNGGVGHAVCARADAVDPPIGVIAPRGIFGHALYGFYQLQGVARRNAAGVNGPLLHLRLLYIRRFAFQRKGACPKAQHNSNHCRKTTLPATGKNFVIKYYQMATLQVKSPIFIK